MEWPPLRSSRGRSETVSEPSGVEAEPLAAARIVGSALPTLRRYVADLTDSGEELGLLGPREYSRIWTRHILNCALAAREVTQQCRKAADVGSGAGLPGIVLAAMTPEVHWTLIETMERRAAWLRGECDALGLNEVEVVCGRAEDVPGDIFDLVTARAVAPLRKLLPWCAPLLTSGGKLVLIKGQKANEEISASTAVAKRLGVTGVHSVLLEDPDLETPTTVVLGRIRR